MKYFIIILIISTTILTGFDFQENIQSNFALVKISIENNLIFEGYLGPKLPLKYEPTYSSLKIKSNKIGKTIIVFNNLVNNKNILIEGNAKWKANNTLIIDKNSEVWIKNIPFDHKNIIAYKAYLNEVYQDNWEIENSFEIDEFCGTLFPKKKIIPDILLERLRLKLDFDEKPELPEYIFKSISYTIPDTPIEIPIKIWIKNEFDPDIRINQTASDLEILMSEYFEPSIVGENIEVAIVRHDILRANQIFDENNIKVNLIFEIANIYETGNDLDPNTFSGFDANTLNMVYIGNNYECEDGVFKIGFTLCNTASDCNCENANFKNIGLISSFTNNETLLHEIGHTFALAHRFGEDNENNIMYDNGLERNSFIVDQHFIMNFNEYSFLNKYRRLTDTSFPSLNCVPPNACPPTL